jgi:hypothetical protein
MLEAIRLFLDFIKILKVLRWLRVVWTIIKLCKRVHNAFHDIDPVTSLMKTTILKTAMEAVDEGDVLSLNSSITEFDKLLPS